MKVILLRDVAKIGKRYEVVEVPDGFALNKLIPQGDAEAATANNIKRVANMRQKNQTNNDDLLLTLKKIASDLTSNPLTILMQANEQGHLFKAVSANDVSAAASLRDVKIPAEYVIFEEVIKSLGEHTVALKNQGERFSFNIKVIAK